MDEVHRRLCQGEDVWQKRDPRSTSTDLMVWFNAKAANEEAFPFLEWFQVMEYGSINLRNISERLGSSHPISPEISQSVAVALLSNKKFEVREALVYYLLSRLSEGMEVTPELYDALLSQITRSENENVQRAAYAVLEGGRETDIGRNTTNPCLHFAAALLAPKLQVLLGGAAAAPQQSHRTGLPGVSIVCQQNLRKS